MIVLVMNMINIGLTGWGDHETLYEDIGRQADKLQTYAGHFQLLNWTPLIMRFNLKEIY